MIRYVDNQFKDFISTKKLESNIVKFFHSFILKIKYCSEGELKVFYEQISDIMALIYEKTLFTFHYIKYL